MLLLLVFPVTPIAKAEQVEARSLTLLGPPTWLGEAQILEPFPTALQGAFVGYWIISDVAVA